MNMTETVPVPDAASISSRKVSRAVVAGIVLAAVALTAAAYLGWHLVPAAQPAATPPDPREGEAVARLRRHLSRPDTLTIHRVRSHAIGRTHIVEVEFSAAGPAGQVGRTRFWVRWSAGVPADALPEGPDGDPLNPGGVFRAAE